MQDRASHLTKIKDHIEQPQNDVRDRINTLSWIISGVLVAAIILYARHVNGKRSANAERKDTVIGADLPSHMEDYKSGLQKIRHLPKQRQKDIWDKINTLSGIISGILVAAIGFYATQVYDQRSRNAEREDRERNVVAVELQTVEKFLPHLASNNEIERQAALEAISSLANPPLAAKMATIFRGSGARAALINLDASATTDTKASIEYALTDLFKEFSSSIVRVYIQLRSGQQASQGTGFYISRDGYVVTSAHLFPSSHGSDNSTVKISVLQAGAMYQAALTKISTDLDVAVVKVDVGHDVVPVKLSDAKLTVAERVTIMGFSGGDEVIVTTGILSLP